MVEIVLGSVVFVFGSLGKQNSEVRVEGFGREKLIMVFVQNSPAVPYIQHLSMS